MPNDEIYCLLFSWLNKNIGLGKTTWLLKKRLIEKGHYCRFWLRLVLPSVAKKNHEKKIVILNIPDAGGSDNDGSASDGNWRPSEIVTAQASTRPKERKREGPSAKKPRGSMASSTGGTTK